MKNSQLVPEPSPELIRSATDTRNAAVSIGQSSNDQRRSALIEIAKSLSKNTKEIVNANQEDLERCASQGLSKALTARLRFGEEKLQAAIEGVREVAQLPDPIGLRQMHRELDKELILERRTVPLGVLGVIFESRPDALVQIASLAIRSGNGAILKGGSEASITNKTLIRVLHNGLSNSDLDPRALLLLETRQESLALLRLDRFVDLMIPRGSNDLVRFIQDNTRIPVLGHADGICHLYIDKTADLEKALKIALDSKTQYPAACNAIETLLVHEEIAANFLAKAVPLFDSNGVTLLGDKVSRSLGVSQAASEKDWETEYLDMTLSIKVVNSLETALEHINQYGSRHTESIVCEDKETAEKFMSAVDSAGVYHNCSTRFADGFRYGFGAEVGISTQTLPPRGPVGLEGLVTYRYKLRGDGHIAADFVSGKSDFSHVDLPL